MECVCEIRRITIVGTMQVFNPNHAMLLQPCDDFMFSWEIQGDDAPGCVM